MSYKIKEISKNSIKIAIIYASMSIVSQGGILHVRKNYMTRYTKVDSN